MKNKLYNILKPFFTFDGNLNSLQTQVWKKVCSKAETNPHDLTPLEAFQIGKFTQKAIDHNEEKEGSDKNEETKYLRNLQDNVKFSFFTITK